MIRKSFNYEAPLCDVVDVLSQGAILAGSEQYGKPGKPGPDADEDDLGNF